MGAVGVTIETPLCSTSNLLQSGVGKPRRGRHTSCRTFAAQDAFCKDKVNSSKAPVHVEGTSTVSFLGAGGQEISIECPKVGGQSLALKGTLHNAESAQLCGVCPVQDTYILEAGLNNDVELPYTCRGGICG